MTTTVLATEKLKNTRKFFFPGSTDSLTLWLLEVLLSEDLIKYLDVNNHPDTCSAFRPFYSVSVSLLSLRTPAWQCKVSNLYSSNFPALLLCTMFLVLVILDAKTHCLPRNVRYHYHFRQTGVLPVYYQCTTGVLLVYYRCTSTSVDRWPPRWHLYILTNTRLVY